MFTNSCKGSYAQEVNFHLLLIHFIDCGFEIILQHQKDRKKHYILFNQELKILCDLESSLDERDTEYSFSNCHLIFELEKNNTKSLEEEFVNMDGSYDRREFKSRSVWYYWYCLVSRQRKSVTEIINYFKNEKWEFKTKWEAKDHSLSHGLGLNDYDEPKNHIKSFIEQIVNTEIRTFLLNYYEKNLIYFYEKNRY